MKTILVVDDERHIVDLVRLYLEKEGFAVVAADDGAEALDRHARHDPDLVILDLMLPEGRRLRGLPRDPAARRHAGPDADRPRRRRRRDRRARARRRRLRHQAVQPAGARRPGQGDPSPDRRRPPAAAGRSRSAPLRIDPRRREATVGRPRRLDLRAREFDLLAALARDPGVVLTRDGLLEDVWGTDFPGETRTVDVHVGEVRRKLGAGRPADRDRPRGRLPARAAGARAGPGLRPAAD